MPPPFTLNMRHVIVIFGFVAAIVLSGCSDSGKADGTVNGDIIKISDADPNLILARIGTNSVTCGDFRQRLDFELGIWRLGNPKKDGDKAAADRFCAQRMQHIIPELLNQKGVASWLEMRGIPFTEAEAGETERDVLKRLGFRGDVEALAKKTACSREYVSRQLCASARMKKACLAYDPSAGEVSEKEIDDGMKRLDLYYERAVASNAVTWATCSNVIDKINRGVQFSKAATMYGYSDIEDGEKWGDFMVSAIEDEKLRNWAGSSPAGSMRIFELDDGISIVKILERTEGVSVKSGVRTSDVEVSLARINFAMVEPEPEPRTRDHVKSALLQWKMRNVQKRLGEKITERFPIVYPNEKAKIEL